jgi:hypothetical protein
VDTVSFGNAPGLVGPAVRWAASASRSPIRFAARSRFRSASSPLVALPAFSVGVRRRLDDSPRRGRLVTKSRCRNQTDGITVAVYPANLPRARPSALTARLERIKLLTDDLARAQGGETPASRALADRIKQDIDIVRRALKRQKP